MTEEVVNNISNRYVELYENVTGNNFEAPSNENLMERIETNIKQVLLPK